MSRAPVPGAEQRPAAGPRFTGLDGLRALAVTAVFAFHGGRASRPIAEPAGRYLVHLDGGVEIFFVLSGFLIYRQFAVAHLGGGPPPAARDYLARRLLRVFPAYWLILLVLGVTGALHLPAAADVLAHGTLTHTYWRDRYGVGLGVSWTLVVELSFYALAPLWARAVAGAGRRVGRLRAELGAAAAGIALGVLAMVWVRFGAPPAAVRVLPPAMPALGAGMVMAVLTAAADRSARLRDRLERAGRPAGRWWAAALGVFLALSAPRAATLLVSPESRLYQDVLQVVIAVLLVFPAVFGAGGLVRRFLAARAVAFAGLVSYGVYLWQGYTLDRVASEFLNGRGVLVAAVALTAAYAVTVAVAAGSYYVLERPALRVAHRVRRPVGARA